MSQLCDEKIQWINPDDNGILEVGGQRYNYVMQVACNKQLNHDGDHTNQIQMVSEHPVENPRVYTESLAESSLTFKCVEVRLSWKDSLS